MALMQLYRCPGVGPCHAWVEHGQPVPSCDHGRMLWKQTRDYKPEAHGWSTGMKAPAIDFAPSRDRYLPLENADGSQMKMESLSQLRALERESEQLERNGEGQAMRFRMYSQEGSNRHDNTFGEPPQRKPNLFRDGKQVVSVSAVDGADADCEMGPGAREELASALEDRGAAEALAPGFTGE